MAKKNGLRKLNRRQALFGLGISATTPLLAARGASALEQRGAKPALESPHPEVFAAGRDQRFDQDWLFHLGDVDGAEAPGFGDSDWRRLDLPHDWSIEDLIPPSDASGEGTIWVGGNAPTRIGPFDVALSDGQEATGWVVGGIGWYQEAFRGRRAGRKSEIEIRFDGVYMNADVWLNGHHVGFHPYGYTSFAYDLTPYLNRDGENILAVRVRNEGRNSRWYSGSGIYRHVWLTMTDKVRFPLWGVSVTTPEGGGRSFHRRSCAAGGKPQRRFRKASTCSPQIIGHRGQSWRAKGASLSICRRRPVHGYTHHFDIHSPTALVARDAASVSR